MYRIASNPFVRLLTIATLALLLLVILLIPQLASAQALSFTVNLNWNAPTTGCTVGVTPCDNATLIPGSLQSYDVVLSTSPIAADYSGAPSVTIPAGDTHATVNLQVNNGQTIYARVRARTTAPTPGPWSSQVSKLVDVPVVPGAPTAVTIQIAP